MTGGLQKDKWEWVQYDFDKPLYISGTKVYWFDDGPDGGCRFLMTGKFLYLNGNIWETVDNLNQNIKFPKMAGMRWHLNLFLPSQ